MFVELKKSSLWQFYIFELEMAHTFYNLFWNRFWLLGLHVGSLSFGIFFNNYINILIVWY